MTEPELALADERLRRATTLLAKARTTVTALQALQDEMAQYLAAAEDEYLAARAALTKLLAPPRH